MYVAYVLFLILFLFHILLCRFHYVEYLEVIAVVSAITFLFIVSAFIKGLYNGYFVVQCSVVGMSLIKNLYFDGSCLIRFHVMNLYQNNTHEK